MKKDLYKKKLEEEKKLLISELKGVGVVKDKRNPDDWQGKPTDMEIQSADENELADKIESYENNTALVQELEGRLNEIDGALSRIANGTFGTCKVCNKEIEEDRLEANPAAATCKEHMNS